MKATLRAIKNVGFGGKVLKKGDVVCVSEFTDEAMLKAYKSNLRWSAFEVITEQDIEEKKKQDDLDEKAGKKAATRKAKAKEVKGE